MGWTRAELWYRGRFRDTVTTLEVARAWEGWIDPLERAPRDLPQRVLVPDRRGKGRFWEFNVRRPWGFDRGRTGDRWGPGYEGLVVARVDPSRLAVVEGYAVSRMFRGPVRVVNAHPGAVRAAAPLLPLGTLAAGRSGFQPGAGGEGFGDGTGRCAGRCWRWTRPGG